MKTELHSFLMPTLAVDPLEALAVLRKASAYPVDQLRAQTDKTFGAVAATEDGGAAGPGGGLPPPTAGPGQGGAPPITIEAAAWVVKKMRFDLGWVVKEAAEAKVDLDINIVAFDQDGEAGG